eukprot:6192043-Pleurochrysis_carterae.AAC.3
MSSSSSVAAGNLESQRSSTYTWQVEHAITCAAKQSNEARNNRRERPKAVAVEKKRRSQIRRRVAMKNEKKSHEETRGNCSEEEKKKLRRSQNTLVGESRQQAQLRTADIRTASDSER